MRRRDFLKGVTAATVMGCGSRKPATTALLEGTTVRTETAQPNILFIITDQQSAEAMSCAIGNEHIKTPAMDSLARTGRRFTRAYSPNPLCVPARSSIFTGRYPHETGIQFNDWPKRLDPSKFPVMGTVFRDAGYDTGYVGKWHLPYNKKDTSAHGFGYVANLKDNGSDNGSPEPAAEFIERRRDRPFLLVASFVNPHNICEWARGDELPDGPIGDPPPPERCPPLRKNHEPPSGETDIMALARRSVQANKALPVGGFDDGKWRQYAWAYYRMIEMVDGHIRKVLDALRRSGREENTLVVFTSDHGDCQGAHKWNQKTVFYDESARVPLIFSYPGVTEPGICDRLVNTGVDIIPSLCGYAGIPVPKALPGMSLKDVPSTDPRKYVVASNHLMQGAPIDGETPKPQGRMVRSRRFKYCKYDMGRRTESLVDMEADPGETVNLADNADYADVLAQHRGYLKDHCSRTDDDFLARVGL